MECETCGQYRGELDVYRKEIIRLQAYFADWCSGLFGQLSHGSSVTNRSLNSPSTGRQLLFGDNDGRHSTRITTSSDDDRRATDCRRRHNNHGRKDDIIPIVGHSNDDVIWRHGDNHAVMENSDDSSRDQLRAVDRCASSLNYRSGGTTVSQRVHGTIPVSSTMGSECYDGGIVMDKQPQISPKVSDKFHSIQLDSSNSSFGNYPRAAQGGRRTYQRQVMRRRRNQLTNSSYQTTVKNRQFKTPSDAPPSANSGVEMAAIRTHSAMHRGSPIKLTDDTGVCGSGERCSFGDSLVHNQPPAMGLGNRSTRLSIRSRQHHATTGCNVDFDPDCIIVKGAQTGGESVCSRREGARPPASACSPTVSSAGNNSGLPDLCSSMAGMENSEDIYELFFDQGQPPVPSSVRDNSGVQSQMGLGASDSPVNPTGMDPIALLQTEQQNEDLHDIISPSLYKRSRGHLDERLNTGVRKKIAKNGCSDRRIANNYATEWDGQSSSSSSHIISPSTVDLGEIVSAAVESSNSKAVSWPTEEADRARDQIQRLEPTYDTSLSIEDCADQKSSAAEFGLNQVGGNNYSTSRIGESSSTDRLSDAVTGSSSSSGHWIDRTVDTADSQSTPTSHLDSDINNSFPSGEYPVNFPITSQPSFNPVDKSIKLETMADDYDSTIASVCDLGYSEASGAGQSAMFDHIMRSSALNFNSDLESNMWREEQLPGTTTVSAAGKQRSGGLYEPSANRLEQEMPGTNVPVGFPFEEPPPAVITLPDASAVVDPEQMAFDFDTWLRMPIPPEIEDNAGVFTGSRNSSGKYCYEDLMSVHRRIQQILSGNSDGTEDEMVSEPGTSSQDQSSSGLVGNNGGRSLVWTEEDGHQRRSTLVWLCTERDQLTVRLKRLVKQRLLMRKIRESRKREAGDPDQS